jgi:hypothetical protein
MRLTRSLLLSAVIAWGASAPVPAHADRQGFGLGVILGEPTGFTGKYRYDARSALDFGLAWSFSSFFLIYGDYLYHFPSAFRGAREPFFQQLTPYIGGGGALFFDTASRRVGDRDAKYFTKDGDSFGLGIRFVAGLEWSPPSIPLGVFLELAPGVGIVPSTFGFIQGGIGVRYYF